MSRVTTFGGRLSCTASIHRPGNSVSAARFSGWVSISDVQANFTGAVGSFSQDQRKTGNWEVIEPQALVELPNEEEWENTLVLRFEGATLVDGADLAYVLASWG